MMLIFRTKSNRYEVGSPKKEIRSLKMEVFGPEIPELESGF